jgi:hypothetical protein
MVLGFLAAIGAGLVAGCSPHSPGGDPDAASTDAGPPANPDGAPECVVYPTDPVAPEPCESYAPSMLVHGLPLAGAAPMIAVDLDCDGMLDLATGAADLCLGCYAGGCSNSDSAQGWIIVLRGDDHGGFTSMAEMPVAMEPHQITAGDYNGDDAPDLLVSGTVGSLSDVDWGTVAVYGDCAGGFDGPSLVPMSLPWGAGGGPVPFWPLPIDGGPVVADVTGDGMDDLVYARRQSYTCPLLRTGALEISAAIAPECPNLDPSADGSVVQTCDGEGVLYEETVYGTGEVAPTEVRLADLDDDGASDVVVRLAGVGMGWLRNLGEGRFAALEVLADVEPTDVWDVADVDGDGAAEIVLTVACESGWTAIHATAAEAERVERHELADLPEPDGVVVADLDDDGAPELALGLPVVDSGIVVVRPTAPESWFRLAQLGWSSDEPRRLRAIDLDADGVVDLVMAQVRAIGEPPLGEPPCLLVRGPITTPEAPVVEISKSICQAQDVGDFDGDGDLDFLVPDDLDGQPGHNHHKVVLGWALVVSGDGATSADEHTLLAPAVGFTGARLVWDQGLGQDLLLATRGGGLALYRGDSGPTLVPDGPQRGSPASVSLAGAAVADLDGDGVADLVAAGDPVHPFELHVLRACPGFGDP